jgi:two-component system, cell cycle response regulator
MAPDPSSVSPVAASRRVLLLIDDDRAQARIVEAALEKFQGERFHLRWAATYESGLAALAEPGLAACLLDYQLGPRDGLALLREAMSAECEVPIIFLTSETSGEVDAQALEAGALDYLVKAELTPRGLERSLRYAMKQQATLAELRRLATRDPLTGLYNRGEAARRMGRALAAQNDESGATALLLIDVDHFKQINDERGHAEGDRILVQVAATLSANTRAGDTAARWGGDEFALCLSGLAPEAARAVAERVRRAVAALGVSTSIGLVVRASGQETLDALLLAADQALYRAKAAGRNQVCVAPPEPEG